MAKSPKPKTVKGAARVKGKAKRKAGKPSAPTAITIPVEIVTAIGLAVSWFAKNAQAMLGPGGGTGTDCCICTVCDSVPTGQWGLPYRDQAGGCACLAGPTSGDKYVRATANGLYLSNV